MRFNSMTVPGLLMSGVLVLSGGGCSELKWQAIGPVDGQTPLGRSLANRRKRGGYRRAREGITVSDTGGPEFKGGNSVCRPG